MKYICERANFCDECKKSICRHKTPHDIPEDDSCDCASGYCTIYDDKTKCIPFHEEPLFNDSLFTIDD